MEFNIAKYASDCIKTIEEAGFEAYYVGGALRDIMLGTAVSDYDIATNATPQDIIALFEKVLKTGIKHGTVTVVTNGQNIEITTYRSDGKYSDNRHPASVEYIKTIDGDLSRRDFTVNAMAYNENTGLVDPFNGRGDLKRRILKTVGNPYDRFKEDALRILRLFRFSCKLNFKIEDNTLNAAIEQSPLLKSISYERILSEIKNSLLTDYPQNLSPILEHGMLSFAGINKSNQRFDRIGFLPKDISLRFFAFLYLSGSELSALNILKADNKLKQECIAFNEIISLPLPNTLSEAKLVLNKFGYGILKKGLLLKKILNDTNVSVLEQLIEKCINSGEPYKISQLKVNGDDLIKIGITGKDIGKELSRLLKIVIENPELNTKENLINIILSNN